MTLAELNQHLELVEELRTSEELLQGLWEMAAPGAHKLDGMPSSSGVSDPTARIAVEIAEMEDKIERLKAEIEKSEVPVIAFIDEIRNTKERIAFKLRFLEGLSWKAVSEILKYSTPDAPRMAVYQQLKRINKKV